MAISSRTVEYFDGNTVLEGFLAYPYSGTRSKGTVLIAHMWAGRVDFVCQKARELAKLGYTAFALDLYGKGVFGDNSQENAALMQPFIDDRAFLLQRVKLALTTLTALPETSTDKIAAIGYCFGGMCVLDLARSGVPIKGVISVHGLLDPPQTNKQRINSKVLILHGYQDPLASMQSLLALQNELSSANADWQTLIDGNSMHAFTNPVANDPTGGTVYNRSADQRSWRMVLNFLEEVLV